MGNHYSNGSTSGSAGFEEIKALLSAEDLRRLEIFWGRRRWLELDDLLTHPGIPKSTLQQLDEIFCKNSHQIVFDKLLLLATLLVGSDDTRHQIVAHDSRLKAIPRLVERNSEERDESLSLYEVLAGVTHLDEFEISAIETFFDEHCPVGQISVPEWQFVRLVKDLVNKRVAAGLFRAFDENHDGFVDFQEWVCGISALCKGPDNARLQFMIKVLFPAEDQHITSAELAMACQELGMSVDVEETSFPTHTDLLCWMAGNEPLCKVLLTLSQELGHVSLGLPPATTNEALEIICSVKQRSSPDSCDEWCVIPAEWWSSLIVALNPNCPAVVPLLDNSPLLVAVSESRVPSCLPLKDKLLEKRDYELVPRCLFDAIQRWTRSNNTPIVRTAIPAIFFEQEPTSGASRTVELYPPVVEILRHVKNNRPNCATAPYSTWQHMFVSRVTTIEALTYRLAHSMSLDRDDARLWLAEGRNLKPLFTNEGSSVHELGICDKTKLLLEIRNEDMSWPEEVSRLKTGVRAHSTQNRVGTVGLLNTGNACYLNACLQAVSTVGPVRDFFLQYISSGDAKVANEFGALVKNLWTTNMSALTPQKLKAAVAARSGQFGDLRQHDCQEFLSILLDLLTEETKKRDKSTAESETESEQQEKDDASRSLAEWNAYLERERSVVAEAFAGQLDSCVECSNCGEKSSVFDPFQCISLELPVEALAFIVVSVVRRDGSVPVCYGMRLKQDALVVDLKRTVCEKAGIAPEMATFVCMPRTGTNTFDYTDVCNDASAKVSEVPWERIHAYAYELALPPSVAESFPPKPNIIAVHRRIAQRQTYSIRALDGYAVSYFGLPLFVKCQENTCGKDLYDDVMRQVRRFLSGDRASRMSSNRATDASECVHGGYPFVLSFVHSDLEWCASCEWPTICRGCPVYPDSRILTAASKYLAITWKTVALHLRYRTAAEMERTVDQSVKECEAAHYQPLDLDSCFKSYVQPEELHDSECEKCRQRGYRKRTLRIRRPPKILVVHFKRFVYQPYRGDWVKCTKAVHFPVKSFDLSPFTTRDPSTGGCVYNCIAVVNHMGNMNYGHYTACAKRGDQWYLFDDSFCKDVAEDEVDKGNAYLLFYERVDAA